MDADIFVPFLFFGFLTAVIVIPIMARESTKRSAHQLVSQAIARGQPLDAELIERLSQDALYDANRARKSLGNGVILIALAIGFYFAGRASGWDGDGWSVPAIIMGSVGLAFLLLAAIDYFIKPRATH
jgi:protein-S-isoprenylcysteine O-methyltransferase Ste14